MSFTGKRAIYPLLRTVLKSRTVGAGETAAVVNDLHSGRLPSQVIFGLVENSAFRGHRQKNPYHFRNYDITSCQIVVNSKSYPSVRLTTDTNKYFVKIVDLHLTARHVGLRPAFVEHINKALDSGN